MSFLSQCNVEIVPYTGFLGPLLLKNRRFGGRFVPKKDKWLHFFILGLLFGGQLSELFARETNLKKQSSVRHMGNTKEMLIFLRINTFCQIF